MTNSTVIDWLAPVQLLASGCLFTRDID